MLSFFKIVLNNTRNLVHSILVKIGSFIIFIIRKIKYLFSALFTLRSKNITKDTQPSFVPKYVSTVSYKSTNNRLMGCAMFLAGIIFSLIFFVIPSNFYIWLRGLPNPDLLSEVSTPTPTRIYDRRGRLLYEMFTDKKYEKVPINKIPTNLINATIAIEDDQFYLHHGFHLPSMIRAAKSILVHNKLQGGSTITQQLVKNMLLSPDQTIERKLKEIVLAVIVENKYSKSQILELYLNNISYGGTAWGVQAAAQKYFGKNVWDLSLAECSLLAALPSAPSTYSPVAGGFDLAKPRQKYVLDRMYQLGYITNKEALQAYEEKLNFVKQAEYIRAPHFVNLVRNELEELYGRRFVEFGGLSVTTSLDLDLQDKVQEIVSTQVNTSANLNITNGAAAVLDSRSAEILAYVGSVDYFTADWGAYDVATAYRQPGSSIKPLTYALALENGYTTISTIKDSAVTFNVSGQKPYTPINYDNRYHGNVTLRSALANSYNIPAVRLAAKLGPDKIVSLGRSMGLSNWVEGDGSYGLSITLGGKEVRLLDHTNMYATFARAGVYKKYQPIISIKDSNGYEIFKKDNYETRPISNEIAYIIWHILSDNNARRPAFGTDNSLTVKGKTIAVKTGTTDLKRDNYTMGFTPSYTVGVWVGNNDNTPLDKNLASGLSGAAPIWQKIMTFILEGKQDETMAMPDNIIIKKDNKCTITEIFIKGTKIPSSLCTGENRKSKED